MKNVRMIVTGGGSGIGYAVAAEALARGASVSVFDVDPTGAPDGALQYKADVTDDDSVVRAVDEAAAEMGGLDVVVNNAGIGAQGTIETNSIDEWQRVFDVNVFGIVRVSSRRDEAPEVVAARGDRQHMLDLRDRGFARACAVQRNQGCRDVAHVRDGRRPSPRGHPRELREPRHRRHPVDRPAAREGPRPRGGARRTEARQPSGRLVSAEEVADAILYLASPSASATTGMALAVDGGMQGVRLRPRTP